MVVIGRRLLLRWAAFLMAVATPGPRAAGQPYADDDDIVVVRGWVLRRSDLGKLGW